MFTYYFLNTTNLPSKKFKTITKIFDITFHSVEFWQYTSTEKNIITTSRIPVRKRQPKKDKISLTSISNLNDLLLKTKNLLVIYAKATAIVQAIHVDATFENFKML